MRKYTFFKFLILFIFIVGFQGPQDFYDPPDDPNFNYIFPRVGDQAPDFTLKDLTGAEVRLSQFRKKLPVLLVFGSYTCPVYRSKVKPIEELYERYKDKLAIFVVYTIEAHPVGSSPYFPYEWITYPNEREKILFAQPQTYQERIRIAKECVDKLKIGVPILLDEMDDGVWSVFGKQPNSGFLIDINGKIVEKQNWFKAEEMKKAIASLLKRQK